MHTLFKTVIKPGPLVNSAASAVPAQYTQVAFQPKSTAGKAYATDGTGKHVHAAQAHCSDPNCSTKKWDRPCGPLTEIVVTGHFTHNPPPGTPAEDLGATDFAGNQTQGHQYVTKAVTRPVITADDAKHLTEDDIKPSPKAVVFSNLSQEISTKIND